jgi:hypothetical protein
VLTAIASLSHKMHQPTAVTKLTKAQAGD